MVGQTNLLNKLENMTLDNFPKSVLLLGERGCGKHTYLKLISNKLDLNCVDVTEVIDFDFIIGLYGRSVPSIYYIDMDSFTERKQNIILKFLEEPPANAYIILLSSDKTLLLPTIINRCTLFEFERYRYDELIQFIESGEDRDLICNVLTTPGQILEANTDNINKLYDLCVKLVEKLDKASYVNTLSISNKINYKDEYDKFDLLVFFNMLNYVFLEEYRKTNNKRIIDYLKKTVQFRRRLEQDKRLNKQQLFENYLSELWELSRWT